MQGPWNWGGLTWWSLFFGTYSIVALSLSLYGTRVHWPQENGLGHLLALLGNVTKNPREKPNICPMLVAMHNSIWLTSLLTYSLDRRSYDFNPYSYWHWAEQPRYEYHVTIAGRNWVNIAWKTINYICLMPGKLHNNAWPTIH